MLEKFIGGDFIAIAGEMRRFPASNETLHTLFFLRMLAETLVFFFALSNLLNR